MTDSQLHSQLRKRFNPDDSALRRHQLLMLDMLKKIDAICRRHDIRYWLSSGTCLGAVRHGGFIPWDDDVDIEMMEKDYKRLRRVMREYEGSDLVWQDSATDHEYVQPFAKIRDTHSEICEVGDADANYKYRGVFIDIFAMLPSSSRRLYKLGEKFQRVFFYRAQRIRHKRVRRAVLAISRFAVGGIVFPLINALSRIGANGRLRHRLGTEFSSPRFKADIASTRQAQFEDTMLPVPIGVDNYLRQIYGDYMSLPDLDSIHPHITDIKYLQ